MQRVAGHASCLGHKLPPSYSLVGAQGRYLWRHSAQGAAGDTVAASRAGHAMLRGAAVGGPAGVSCEAQSQHDAGSCQAPCIKQIYKRQLGTAALLVQDHAWQRGGRG